MSACHDIRRAVDGYQWRRVPSFYLGWTNPGCSPSNILVNGVHLHGVTGLVVPVWPIEGKCFQYCVPMGLLIRETHHNKNQLMREQVRKHLMGIEVKSHTTLYPGHGAARSC